MIEVFLAEYLIWPVLLAPVLLIFKNHPKSGLHSAFAGFSVWMIGEFFKSFFFVPRPFMTLDRVIQINTLLDGSFPSNHTAVSFAIAFSVFHSHPRLGLFLLGLSLCVGIGRVLVAVHYPIDVLGGIILGFLVSYLTAQIVFRH